MNWRKPLKNRTNLSLYLAVVAVLLLGCFDTASAQATLVVDPTSLAFSYAGTGAPSPQALTVTSSTGANLPFTTAVSASWLQVSQPSGITPTTLSVTVNPFTLAVGTYNATVTLNSGPSTVMVPVTLTVSAIATGTITASPTSVSFSFQTGGATPNQQTVLLSSASSVSFTATPSTTSGGTWLLVSPTTGTTNANLNIGVNPAGLAAGTYNGTVTVNVSGTSNSLQIPVTLTVGGISQLQVAPASLVFNYQSGTSLPVAQSLSLNSSGASLGFTLSANSSGWLVVSSTSGATPTTVSVGVNPLALSPGSYSGSIVISAPGSSNTPVTVPVTLNISTNPLLNFSPTQLSFMAPVGGSSTAAQTISLSSTGTALNYTVTSSISSGGTNWLIVSPLSGATPSSLSVVANPAGLAPGTYSGSIVVTGSGAGNGPQTIPVTFTVTNTALLSPNPGSLSFNFQIGQANPPTQTVTVFSTGAPLSFGAAATTNNGGSWLSVGSLSGTTTGSLSISVNPAGLSAGTYTGNVTLTSAGAGNSPANIPVTLTVSTTPLLNLSPTTLGFLFTPGGALPNFQTVAATSTDPLTPLNFSVSTATSSGGTNWLVVSPVAGSTFSNLSIGVNPTGLPPGNYSGTVTVSPTGAIPQTVAVSLAVASGVTIGISPASLAFTQAMGGAAPAVQTISLTGVGGNVSFTATPSTSVGGSWLSVTPASGTTPATLSVSVNGTGLSQGIYSGSITIVGLGGSTSPQTVPVTLTIGAGQTLSVTPSSLAFTFQVGSTAPAAQAIAVGGSSGLAFTASAATTAGGTWLSVTPASGTTPGNVSVSINPIGLAPGAYSGTVTISSPGAANSPQTVNVTLTVMAMAAPVPTVITNAATFGPTAVAPGLIVSIFGTGIGPLTPATLRVNAAGTVETTLADTRVLFDGIPAPLISVSSMQVNAIVPYEIAGRSTTRLQLEFQGIRSNPLDLRVVDTALGMFTLNATSTGSGNGTGQGAILNENGSINGISNPAQKGSAIVIYATGEGQTNPSGITGGITGSLLRRPLQPVTVTIGGRTAVVDYIGAAPGLVSGVLQVNARIPADLDLGGASVANVPVRLTIAGSESQPGVTVAVQ